MRFGCCLLALLVSGCNRDVGNHPADAAVLPARQPVEMTANTTVDLLLMIDNSNGLSAAQTELKARFPDFFAPFDTLAATGIQGDFHIGVVTSDYGAGATGAPGCSPSPGGDGGRLQPIGRKASANCRKPTGGVNFLRYVFGGNPGDPATSNLPPGQNLVDTFTCMASVGDTGCGFEHQLESVYAALRGNIPDNAGFLRDEALLVVLFFTDEDDGSAPPDTDVFDKNRTAEYGFEDGYSRETRFAVVCCPPGQTSCAAADLRFPPYRDSGGPLYGCRPAPNQPTGAGPGKQYDASRYTDLFTKTQAQGGLKADPNDVILFAIDPPETPFRVIQSNPGTLPGQPYIECPQVNEQSNPACVPVLEHSCVNQEHPEFIGDPAVRLNWVVRSALKHGIANYCDGDFAPAMRKLASLITSRFVAGCVTFPLPAPNGTPHADCVVTDTSLADPNVSTPIPSCRSGRATPCWRLETDAACAPLSPQGMRITIDRGGTAAPPGTAPRAACVPG